MHDEEAAGNLSLGLLPFTVGHGWVADILVKESAERAEALKSNFEADVGDAQLIAAEQLFSFFEAAFDEVLMRRLVECLPEETKEMVA